MHIYIPHSVQNNNILKENKLYFKKTTHHRFWTVITAQIKIKIIVMAVLMIQLSIVCFRCFNYVHIFPPGISLVTLSSVLWTYHIKESFITDITRGVNGFQQFQVGVLVLDKVLVTLPETDLCIYFIVSSNLQIGKVSMYERGNQKLYVQEPQIMQ